MIENNKNKNLINPQISQIFADDSVAVILRKRSDRRISKARFLASLGMTFMRKLRAYKWVIASILIPPILFFAFNDMPYLTKEGNDAAMLRTEDAGNLKKTEKELSKRNKKMKNMLAGLLPKGNYIMIDTAKNIIYLKNGNRVLHHAIISTGSGKFLIDPANQERKWIFDTPRGEFKIKSKVVEPVWVKPDWAFIEEGEDIPKNYSDRMEPGVLGDYALGIGNGYFIHGTLYTRLLGKPVTHGCIRVGDGDLKIIYKAARIGTKVYIF